MNYFYFNSPPCYNSRRQTKERKGEGKGGEEKEYEGRGGRGEKWEEERDNQIFIFSTGIVSYQVFRE